MSAPALTVFGLDVPWDCRTLEGFRVWAATLDERGPRVSFARGRLHVEMSPQSYTTHEPLVHAINVRLSRLAGELDLGRYYLPPSWLTHEPSALSTEPDGMFARWSTLESGLLALNPQRATEMIGRPDMVLEVVSDSSQRKDTVEHVLDYALAGVGEYWIGDARGESATLCILALGANATYTEVVADGDGWLVSPTWGRAFRVRALPPRAGQRDFVLDVRADTKSGS